MILCLTERKMKKYILALIFAITAPYVWAQNVQHGNVMPGFFVPNGALKTNSTPEKLPPIETMTYGQKNPAFHNNAQIQKPQAQNNAQNNATETVSVNNANNNNANSVAKPTRLSTSNEQIKKLNSFLPQAIEKTTEEQSDIVDNDKNTTNDTVSDQPSDNTASSAVSAQDIFAQIFEEYQKDIQAISKNEFVENKRLLKILADYKNQEHLF